MVQRRKQRAKRYLTIRKIIMHDFDELDNIKPDTLTDKELKVILDNAKLIKSWLDAVDLTSLICLTEVKVLTAIS